MKPLGMNTTINGGEKEEEGVSQLVGEVSGKKLIFSIRVNFQKARGRKEIARKQSTGHFP
jgi:hypothetical protein